MAAFQAPEGAPAFWRADTGLLVLGTALTAVVLDLRGRPGVESLVLGLLGGLALFLLVHGLVRILRRPAWAAPAVVLALGLAGAGILFRTLDQRVDEARILDDFTVQVVLSELKADLPKLDLDESRYGRILPTARRLRAEAEAMHAAVEDYEQLIRAVTGRLGPSHWEGARTRDALLADLKVARAALNKVRERERALTDPALAADAPASFRAAWRRKLETYGQFGVMRDWIRNEEQLSAACQDLTERLDPAHVRVVDHRTFMFDSPERYEAFGRQLDHLRALEQEAQLIRMRSQVFVADRKD